MTFESQFQDGHPPIAGLILNFTTKLCKESCLRCLPTKFGLPFHLLVLWKSSEYCSLHSTSTLECSFGTFTCLIQRTISSHKFLCNPFYWSLHAFQLKDVLVNHPILTYTYLKTQARVAQCKFIVPADGWNFD